MLNTVILQGRFVHSLELRKTNSGKSVLSTSVAVQRNRKNADGNYPCDFINIVFWDKTAEFVASHFAKGDTILVRGRLEGRKYTDKEGKDRTSFEVQVEEASFCGKRSESPAQPAADSSPANATVVDAVEDGDAPF